YAYGLTTGTLPFGMLVPFDGGNQLRAISPQESSEGQAVRFRGKVWFRIQAAGRQQVSQRLEQRIFHGLMVLWLLLWALLMNAYGSKRWLTAALWDLGLMVGNLWLWGSDFGGSRFFEPVYGMSWRMWSQGGIMFNVLWIALGLRVFRTRLGSWGIWTAWSGLYLAWALLLDTGKVKMGWANPVTWSWDDGAWVMALLVIMVLAANWMRRFVVSESEDQRPLVLVGITVLGIIGVMLWGTWAGWTLWGWILGLGYVAWMFLGWCWKRYAHRPSGLNMVLGLMGLLGSLLIDAQHWRIQVSSAQGQLATLVEPRPLEAYTYFHPFIDSLRGDEAWLDSSSLSLKDRSGSILDKHYSNLSPFFDLLSSQLSLNTLDSMSS
ncbi:MAG: hypothetical protein ACKODJ_02840, partial [Bacteroidota bacterium]